MTEHQPLNVHDLPQLLEVLQGTLVHDTSVQKAAESTVKALESRVGYCSCLTEILLNKSVDHSLRWLAATQLKNCVVRHWRPTAVAGSISQQEQTHIRSQLLRLVDQDDNQIASQVAVTFAKVARIDYPKAWPTLFTDLLSLPQQPNCPTVVLRRVYLILHAVLKELASKRLAADQRAFAEVSQQLLEPMWRQWLADTQALSSGLPAVQQGLASVRLSSSDPLLVTFERWLFVLKALRRIVLFGFPSDVSTGEPVPTAVQVAPSLHRCLVGMLSFAGNVDHVRGAQGPGGAVATRLLALLDRGLLKLAKTLVNLQERFPWSLWHCGTLGAHMELSCTHVVAGGWSASAPAAQRVIVQMMLFMQQGQVATNVQQALIAFWSAERLQAVLAALLQQYLPLSSRELRDWHAAPEEFHHGSDEEQQDHLRTAAMQLLEQLLEAHRSAAIPLVQQALESALRQCPAGATLEALQGPCSNASPGGPGQGLGMLGAPRVALLKAAVYNALGTAHEVMFDAVDFSQLLQQALLPDITCSSEHLWPVRRQAMKLLGQWAARLEAQHQPTVYSVLSDVIAPADQDPALSLMAVESLRSIVDDWSFQEDALLPHLPLLFERLARLLTSLQELDSLLQVFSLVNLLVLRMGAQLQPMVPGLLHLLPSVWSAANTQSLLRLQVLMCMSRIVNATGVQSPIAYPVLLPLLQQALGSTGNEELVLLEEGLALWLVALRNAPDPAAAQQLLQLLPHLCTLLSQSTEHLPLGCAILRSSLYLGQQQLMATYAAALKQLLLQLLGNVNERGMCLLLSIMELAIQLCPDDKCLSTLQPALLRLLSCLFGGQEAEAGTVAGLAVLNRVLLCWPQQFLALFNSAAAAGSGLQRSATSGEALLCQYVDRWMDNIDNIGHAIHRKLGALAACQLLTLPVPGLLNRLDLVAVTVSAALAEGVELQLLLPPLAVDSEMDADEAVAYSVDAQGESQRREQVSANDPVNTLQVSAVFQQCISSGKSLHGLALHQALQQLDPHLLATIPAT